jgi:uncharacterized tellurite resistance protein B-like protein
MKEISKSEKFAIVHVLSKIMSADGIIHPKEEEYMNHVYSELGISIGDIEYMSDMDDIAAKRILNGMDCSQKDYVRKLFLSMAESDGYIHPSEHLIIESIFEQS